MTTATTITCTMCASTDTHIVFKYSAAPDGETTFGFFKDRPYERTTWRCETCGHFINEVPIDLDRLYDADYVDSTYGNAAGIAAQYHRIMALPPEKSDNYARVQRVANYTSNQLGRSRPYAEPAPTLLDVGSGLAVFPARMKAEGWQVTALDPDPRAVHHARTTCQVDAIRADFMDELPEIGPFDLVTFNKVLEHVPDPVAMLARTQGLIAPGGLVYVELPDGEMALREGSGRNEFCLAHRCAFSMTSISMLMTRAGFESLLLERVHEASSKFSLRAFGRVNQTSS